MYNKSIRARQAALTREWYAYERKNIKPGLDTPIAKLRELGERVWRENTGRRDRCPTIIAGKGIKQSGRYLSYCEGRSKIVFARHERRIPVLIHEMVHALGPETHGRRFRRLFFDLMKRYT